MRGSRDALIETCLPWRQLVLTRSGEEPGIMIAKSAHECVLSTSERVRPSLPSPSESPETPVSSLGFRSDVRSRKSINGYLSRCWGLTQTAGRDGWPSPEHLGTRQITRLKRLEGLVHAKAIVWAAQTENANTLEYFTERDACFRVTLAQFRSQG